MPKKESADTNQKERWRSVLSALVVTPETIVDDASSLPGLFMVAADFRVEKMREASAADMQLDQARAQADAHIRQEAEEVSEKVTEAMVKARTETDTQVAKARERFNEAEAFSEYARLLVEAVRIKRDCLEIVSRLTMTERSIESGQQTVMLQRVKQSLNDKYPGKK